MYMSIYSPKIAILRESAQRTWFPAESDNCMYTCIYVCIRQIEEGKDTERERAMREEQIMVEPSLAYLPGRY